MSTDPRQFYCPDHGWVIFTGHEDAHALARMRADLDVDRLTEALAIVGWHHAGARQQAETIAAEYARLISTSPVESDQAETP